MATTGLIYDIQGFSIHDGPGIRTTVFLKGCPLRCPWCHSPESQSFKPQICFKKTSCIGIEKCGACLNACPHGALAVGEQDQAPLSASELADVEAGSQVVQRTLTYVRLDRSRCIDCGECAKACIPKALYICGKPYTPKQALARVVKDRAFYDSSGGGVTLSGGEALSQLAFAVEFLSECKKAGLHTALDTTGFAAQESIEAVLPYIDLFLYDIKHMDSQAHERTTGVPNERILSNARLIAHHGAKIQVRIPVIPQFNDSDENMERTALLCKELGDGVACVQLLPYHSLGLQKYERLQWDKPVFAAPDVSDERVARLATHFEAHGITHMIH